MTHQVLCKEGRREVGNRGSSLEDEGLSPHMPLLPPSPAAPFTETSVHEKALKYID